MSGSVGSSLDTWPEVGEYSHVHAIFDPGRRCPEARIVADLAVNAVVVEFVARSYRVDVICEWPILDAVEPASAVTAKAEKGVQDVGCGESTSITFFIPVPNVA